MWEKVGTIGRLLTLLLTALLVSAAATAIYTVARLSSLTAGLSAGVVVVEGLHLAAGCQALWALDLNLTTSITLNEEVKLSDIRVSLWCDRPDRIAATLTLLGPALFGVGGGRHSLSNQPLLVESPELLGEGIRGTSAGNGCLGVDIDTMVTVNILLFSFSQEVSIRVGGPPATQADGPEGPTSPPATSCSDHCPVVTGGAEEVSVEMRSVNLTGGGTASAHIAMAAAGTHSLRAGDGASSSSVR